MTVESQEESQMDQKLPYYMAYPTPLLYDDERRDRMDFEYMKSMYPDAAKQLLPYIEDEVTVLHMKEV